MCLAHDNLGHAATKRTYLSMAQKYFWQSMYPDVQRYTETCVVCQRSKISSKKSTLPLNPLPVATKPFQTIHIDHKCLPRKTKQGHCALLCCVDAFSKFPIVSPVPDYSATTTAKVLMRDVISVFGVPSVIVSDRGSSFTGALFTELTKILNSDHKISATHSVRTNGAGEACVKRIVEGIRLYAKDDLSIEDVLPTICMGLRASVHSKTCVSPYEVLFGRPMPVANPPATLQLDDKLSTSAKEYAKLIHDTLTD